MAAGPPRPRLRDVRALVAAGTGSLLLAACSSGGSVPTPPPATATPPSGTLAPSLPSTTSPAPSPTRAPATLAQCPSQPASASALAILHRGGQPDDLAAGTAGGLWVSDTTAGTVAHLTATGAVDITFSGFSSPEGLVPLANGDLLVAEQGRNRVVTVHRDGTRSVFATLQPPGNGAEGVDGIGIDTAGGRVLIPDSPHGTLLATPVSAGTPLTQLAAGLGRPVGAAVGPDGAIYVTAEDAAPRGLFRIPARGGAAQTVGSLRQLDDIVALDGLLDVTDLAAGTVVAVDPASGAQRILVTGLGQPQGLEALPGGRLAVADSNSGTVRSLAAC
jgi:sugar lactone lactonase YvrE